MSADATSEKDQDQETLPDVTSMRVKEIQAELKDRNVSYADCFDKESLAKRLHEARENPAVTSSTKQKSEEDDNADSVSSSEKASKAEAAAPTSSNETKKKDFDRDGKLSDLRAMRVRELREECAKRNIRWAQFVEKEDLIQALIVAIENSADFSVSGAMEPGKVTELTGEQLEQELSQPSEAPLLLDIFATWCGPCQMMAPQLEAAASELGDRVRVGKIDSDKHAAMAQKLKAKGLPTVLVLNGSEELNRIEGALMKDQILQFVEPYI